MDSQNIANITIYADLLIVLKERGYSDVEANAMVLDIMTQAEMEVAEEMMSRLSDEELALLDSLPDDAPSNEIAEKLGLDGEKVDLIRAEKVAKIISELVPVIDQNDNQAAVE
jgi:FixJ family two-component response regulator